MRDIIRQGQLDEHETDALRIATDGALQEELVKALRTYIQDTSANAKKVVKSGRVDTLQAESLVAELRSRLALLDSLPIDGLDAMRAKTKEAIALISGIHTQLSSERTAHSGGTSYDQ